MRRGCGLWSHFHWFTAGRDLVLSDGMLSFGPFLALLTKDCEDLEIIIVTVLPQLITRQAHLNAVRGSGSKQSVSLVQVGLISSEEYFRYPLIIKL